MDSGPPASKPVQHRMLDDPFKQMLQGIQGHSGVAWGDCCLHQEVSRWQQQRHMNDAEAEGYEKMLLFLFMFG